MKYNELTLSKYKSGRRVGRGISAGRGKTAGRGTKGQGARKSSTKAGFAGGQNPLHTQLPKLRGQTSKRNPRIFKVKTVVNVYTGQLDLIKAEIIDVDALLKAGLISDIHDKIKLITKGEITSKKTVKVQLASAGAIAAVEKAGGSVELVERKMRPTTKHIKKED